MNASQLKDRPPVQSGAELYGSIFQKILHIREEQQEEVTKRQLQYFSRLIDTYRNLLTDIHNGGLNKTDRLLKALEDYHTKYNALVKGVDEPFMLFVVGTGNYGKSTLINALLEEEIAEVDLLPKTWKIDIFRKDLPVNQVIIKYRNNQEKKVDRKKAKSIIEMEEKKRDDSERQITKKLKEFQSKGSSYEAFKEMKLKLEREEIYNSDIVEMHWGMKRVPILEDFYVVDTPGLTQSIMGELRNNVQDYYHKADGVLWMLDATTIAASNAKELVEELEESLSNIGVKQQQNFIAVLNRIDLVYKAEGEDGVKRVLTDAESIYKGYFRAIIPFSAKQAFDGTIAKNHNLIEKSGKNPLLNEIHQAFFKNAKAIQCQKKIESSAAYNHEISLLIQEYRKSLEADVEKLQEGAENIEKQIKKESEKLGKHSNAQLDGYKKRIDENISYQVDTFLNIKDKDAQKNFVEKQIFETHRITNMLNSFQKEEKKVFTDLVNHFIKKIYFTEYPNLQQQASLSLENEIGIKINFGRDVAGENLVTYGSGIAAGLVTSLFLGPLGLVVGGIVSWFAKRGVRDDLSRNLRNKLKTVIKDLTIKMNDSIKQYGDSAYKEIISNAIHSFEDVYSFEGSEDWIDLAIEVEDFLEESDNLLGKLSEPAPNFYPSLKEILL